EAEVIYLTDSQLDTSYRPEGWTIRQVVNHCADSHMNSLVRFKLALTEDKPIIKPYYEERWAELSDSKSMPVIPAIQMLHGIHSRWTILLKSLSDNDIKKTFIHPEHGKEFSIEENIGVYAWHCNHHLAHITTLKKSKGW
ncbi:MAG: putative metal-dependent hydrolase, partial [Opitutaceae bacterium]|nr:putative metal-dependent hydrolase [Cytophagales bacterium]